MFLRTPLFWYGPRGALSALLWPLALVYRVIRGLDVLLHRPKSYDIPVWCVGNVVAGGAGKTPTTLALLQRLQNKEVHVVTRGYGGRLTGPVYVDANAHTAGDVGDEALLLAASAPTVLARRRAAGIEAAITAGAKLIIMDDGLQHTRVRPSRSIIVVDAATGFGNGCLLPAGPLRESLAAASHRAHAVVLIGDGAVDLGPLAKLPCLRASVKADGRALDISARYLAFSGIARPEKFFATARALGLQLPQTISYPDHHQYTLADWHHLLRQARECNAHLLTTTKDAARLTPTQRAQVRQLPITLEFEDEPALQRLLDEWQHA